MPTESKIQDKIEAQVAKNKAEPRRQGRVRTKSPSSVEFFEGCLSSPTIRDLGAYFNVHPRTVQLWMEKDHTLAAAFNRAKAMDAAEMLAIARRKGLDGNMTFWRAYMDAVRPDLKAPDSHVTINTQTTVKVLNKAPADGDVKPFKVIEGESEQVHTPNKPATPDSDLPLFNGKVFHPQS